MSTAKPEVKKKSLKKFFQKTVWLCLIFGLVFVVGSSLAILLLYVFLPSSEDGGIEVSAIVSWITFTTLILLCSMAIFIYVARNSKRVLLRWSRKSVAILMPLVIAGALLSISVANQQTTTSTKPNSLPVVQGNQSYVDGLSLDSSKFLEYTNIERLNSDISPLTLSPELGESAKAKCEDMVLNDYWSHGDKDGRESWHFIDAVGYQYVNAGENLAYGFAGEKETVKGWMNSEGHRMNILDGTFTEVGFGTCVSEDYVNEGKHLIVVQHFATPMNNPGNSQPNVEQSAPTTNFTPEPYVSFVCTKTPIPYKVVYEEVDYLYEGETTEGADGMNGYLETCTADSTGYKPPDYTSEPFDKKIYIGTKPRPSSYESPSSRNYSRCNQFSGTGAYKACVDAINLQ